jgi:hypothetical protein
MQQKDSLHPNKFKPLLLSQMQFFTTFEYMENNISLSYMSMSSSNTKKCKLFVKQTYFVTLVSPMHLKVKLSSKAFLFPLFHIVIVKALSVLECSKLPHISLLVYNGL